MTLVDYFPQNEPLIKGESGTSCSWLSGTARDFYWHGQALIHTGGTSPTVCGERTQHPLACSVWCLGPPGCWPKAFYFQLERLLCLDPFRIRSERQHGKHCEGACSLLCVTGKYHSLFSNVIPMKANKLSNIVN